MPNGTVRAALEQLSGYALSLPELFIDLMSPSRMVQTYTAGLVLTAIGLGGYVAGIQFQYPGRAFSLTAIIIGVTLMSVPNYRTGGAS